MKRIKLTKEQQDMIPFYHDKWDRIVSSCDRVNFDNAKIDLITAYESVNLEPPKKIDFAKGPFESFQLARKEDPNIALSDFIDATILAFEAAYDVRLYDLFGEQCGIKIPSIENLLRILKSSGGVTVFNKWACIMDRPLFVKLDDEQRLHSVEYGDGLKVYARHGESYKPSNLPL